MTTWNDAPMVFVRRPSCPRCHHEQYISVRSMPRESDGSKTLRAVCARCSGRYLIVSEPGGEEEFSEPLPSYGRGHTIT